jgi:hypothetical protein
MLNDDRGPRSDRFPQLYAAVESMYSATQEIACLYVCLTAWPQTSYPANLTLRTGP